MVMSFGTACAKDIQTVLITRFFTGFFGAAPITCTGGVYVDIWPASQRGNAIVGYTVAVCGAPVGRLTLNKSLKWRLIRSGTGTCRWKRTYLWRCELEVDGICNLYQF